VHGVYSYEAQRWIYVKEPFHPHLIHADGIEWHGQRYRSLSVVAREIQRVGTLAFLLFQYSRDNCPFEPRF
jgi:hypothetical protein